jgi:hypothetical protein
MEVTTEKNEEETTDEITIEGSKDSETELTEEETETETETLTTEAETNVSNRAKKSSRMVEASSELSGKCGDNLTWTIEDGTLTISGTGDMWDYEKRNTSSSTTAPWGAHPDTINKLVLLEGITSIGNYAFNEVFNFSGSLVLPNSLKSIGDYAFIQSGFSGELIIPDNVVRIGDGAFWKCENFEKLVLGESVSYIGGGAFCICTGFEGKLVLPKNLEEIGHDAFNGCTGFTGELTFPDSLVNIGDYAFYECSGFTGNLTIPDKVTNIGNNAFKNCKGFDGSLTLAKNLINIGDSAFYGCSKLKGNLILPDNLTFIGKEAFSGCSGFTGNLDIPNGVTEIGDSTFSNCSGLDGSLRLPDNLETIGKNAFLSCSELKGELDIPNTVISIGECAFKYCIGFTGDLIIPDNITEIGDSTFERCRGFNGNLKLPNNLTKIGKYAFSECSGLVGNLEIPDKVIEIGKYAFYSCSGFKGNLTIPVGLYQIDESTFRNCSGFTGSLNIPDSVVAIGDNAFYNCSSFTGDLEISSSVISIGKLAFYRCSGFTGNLDISNSVTSIGNSAFFGCNGFTGTLNISNGITSIGDSVFSGCSGFTGNLIIPKSVTSIGEYAFYNCSSFIGNLTIPNSVTSMGKCAFSGCSGFVGNLEIPSKITIIESGIFKNCSGFTGTLTIPNGVTNIGDNAFGGCSGFTGTLTIPDGVTNIGSDAFSDCSGFTGSLIIPNSVTSIGTGAFYNCKGFTGNLTLSSTLTSIGSTTFEGCNNLSGNIFIPDSITSIESRAFRSCIGISNIIFAGNVPGISGNAFSDDKINAYYPKEKSGWDSVINNNYGGTLTWISYGEGAIPWEMDTSGDAPGVWIIGNTDDEISYSSEAGGYNIKEFTFDITVAYVQPVNSAESYENINLTVELPEGLSFSKDNEDRTLTRSMGTVDTTNNKRNTSCTVYITSNTYTKKFSITFKATADGFEKEQISSCNISVAEENNTVDLSPENYIVSLSPNDKLDIDLASLDCKIIFNQSINNIDDDTNVYLVEYDTGSISNYIEKYNFKGLLDECLVYDDNGNVVIYLNDKELNIFFNRNWKSKTLLKANTKYSIIIDGSIELEDGTNISISDKDFWTFTTYRDEHPLITNEEAASEIPYSLYLKLYKPLTAQLKRWQTDGTNGICYGFAYAFCAWNKGYKGISLIGDNISLKDFKLDTKGKLSYSFKEYMQLAHIYQMCSAIQNEKKENINQYDKLYEAIKKYQNNAGPPILLGVNNEKMGGHEIVPLKIISEDDNSVTVLVYNCNGDESDSKFFGKFVMKKENGKFVDWEYRNYNSDGNSNNYFQFVEVDTTLDNIVLMDSNYDLETSNLIYSKTKISGLDNIVTYGDNNYNDTDKEEYYLYWTEDNIVTRESIDENKMSKLGITDGYKEVSANAPLNSDITLDLNDNSAKLALLETTPYSIEYKNVLEDDIIQTITIDGQASGEVISKQTDDGIVLTADDLTDVVVSIDDGTNSKEVKFSSDDNSVLIIEADNNIVVYEDSDDNGSYDKIIGNNNDNENQGSYDTSNKDDLNEGTEDNNTPSTSKPDDKNIPNNGDDLDNKDESDDGDEKPKDKNKQSNDDDKTNTGDSLNNESNSNNQDTSYTEENSDSSEVSENNGESSNASTSNNSESVENILITALESGYTLNQINFADKHILRASLLNEYHGQRMYLAAIMQPDFGLMIDMTQIPVIEKDIDVSYSISDFAELSLEFNTVMLKADKASQLGFNTIFNFNVGEAYIGKKAYVYMLNDTSTGYDFIATTYVNSIGNAAFTSDKATDYIILVEKQ